MTVDDHPLAGSLERQALSSRRRAGVEPGRLDRVAVGPVDGQLERLGVRQRPDREPRRRSRVAHHDLVAEALDERSRDARRDGADEAHPVRAQAWRQDRHRDHQPAQPAQPGVGQHHVPVRQDVGTADLDDARDLRVVERTAQVVQDVPDADGLATCLDPAGRDHHRQSLRELAQHLERRAARTDDDRARNSVTGTPCAASSAPTAWRLARWCERSVASSPRPPR